MWLKVAFGVAILLLAISSQTEAKPKVKVAVFYEALCPDSKKFITEQLYPAWKKHRGNIQVMLVPYGKATHEKKHNHWEFTCQHGPQECYGNKIQGCILKSKLVTDDKKFDSINCLMSQMNPDQSLDLCLNQVGIGADVAPKIRECSDGSRGSDILAVNGDKTDKIKKPLSFVPTVVFNEHYDSVLQDEAITKLDDVITRLTQAS